MQRLALLKISSNNGMRTTQDYMTGRVISKSIPATTNTPTEREHLNDVDVPDFIKSWADRKVL